MKIRFVLLSLVSVVNCLNYTSDFSSLVDSVWSTYWYDDKASWSDNEKCVNDFQYPVVWGQAVAGKSITQSQNPYRIGLVTANLQDYLNPQGWFSSSTNKDNDVYIDDNAQVLWVLLDAYKIIGNIQSLATAKQLMANIKSQEIDGGGIRWNLDGDYIASISTSEAALAAVRLYQVNEDQTLIDFAIRQIDWIFNNLQDPKDGLIYDGKSASTGEVNKGKLTYSVGTMISTLAYLSSITQDSKYYFQALNLVNSALDPQGAFYNGDGYWNNPLKYSHLLFTGISDLITIYTASNTIQAGYYQTYINELNKQAQHIYSGLQVSSHEYVDNVEEFDASATYCNGQPITSLLDNVSVAQIYYAMSKVSS